MTGRGSPTDLHSHVLPAVDDGAQDLDEALAAVRALVREGVGHIVATPHFRASAFERPGRAEGLLEAFDDAFEALSAALVAADIDVSLGRACEFKLDAPRAYLADPRLRLGGGPAALVEFASFQMPPFGGNQLMAVREAGWIPVLAHPERYAGAAGAIDQMADWVAAGVRLQVNAPSLTGRYGAGPRAVARELFARGLVCVVGSDYHARGAPEIEAARRILGEGTVRTPDGGASPPGALERALDDLFAGNPGRLIDGVDAEPVPPIDLGGA